MDNLKENEFGHWLQNTNHSGAVSLTVKFYVKEGQVSKFRQVNYIINIGRLAPLCDFSLHLKNVNAGNEKHRGSIQFGKWMSNVQIAC